MTDETKAGVDQLVADVTQLIIKYIPSDMSAEKIVDRSNLAVMMLGRSRTTALGALLTAVALAAGTGLSRENFIKLADEMYTRFEIDPQCQKAAKAYQESLIQEQAAKDTGVPLVIGTTKVH